jgi:hypothetical protein
LFHAQNGAFAEVLRQKHNLAQGQVVVGDVSGVVGVPLGVVHEQGGQAHIRIIASPAPIVHSAGFLQIQVVVLVVVKIGVDLVGIVFQTTAVPIAAGEGEEEEHGGGPE